MNWMVRCLASAAVAFFALWSIPTLSAGAPNGTYTFVTASGSATVLGQTYELTPDMIDDFGIVSKTALKVKNNKVKLDRRMADKLIAMLGAQLNVPIQTSVTGPKTMTLKKSGKSWVGKTSRPIVVNFTTTYMNESITGSLRMRMNAKVTKKTMMMEIPITGSALGYNLQATAITKFKR